MICGRVARVVVGRCAPKGAVKRVGGVDGLEEWESLPGWWWDEGRRRGWAGWRGRCGGGKVVTLDDFSVTLVNMQCEDRLAVLKWLQGWEPGRKRKKRRLMNIRFP